MKTYLEQKWAKQIKPILKTPLQNKTSVKLVKSRVDNKYCLSQTIRKGLDKLGIKNIDVKIKDSKIYVNDELGEQDAFEFIFSKNNKKTK